MSYTVVIREYKPNDGPALSDLVRRAYLTNVTSSWFNALTREITFQFIVMFAAVLFIFIGVPLLYCLIAIPLVLLIIYVIIYLSFLMKAAEITHSRRPEKCWVAEVCEPYLFENNPGEKSYRIVSEVVAHKEEFDRGGFRRKIIGTVAVSVHLHVESAAWLFRLAVDESYCRKGIGRALVRTVQNWCASERYVTLELALSECHERRRIFTDGGFEMRQLYHKKLLGTVLTLLMYTLSCDLRKLKPEF